MAYFPMFVDLENKNVLVVGGGAVACRKVQALLPFGAYITVVAPNVTEELLCAGAAEIEMKPFSPVMLKHQDMVIAATDDKKLNHKIAQACREKKIPVNVVDDPEECTFLFPAIVKRGPATVGISTGGASPTAARWLKEEIAKVIPVSFPRLLTYLRELRPVVKERCPEEEVRQKVFKNLFDFCLANKRELTEEELGQMIEEAKQS